jgi:antiviral helicase SLH1
MVLSPQRHSAMEVAARIRSVMPRTKGIAVQTLLSASDFHSYDSAKQLIAVTTPSALIDLEESLSSALIRRLSLVVLEDLHLLDDAYELSIARILSIAKPARTRIVGLTSSLNDPSDLATWLNVDDSSRYCFTPRDRGNPLIVSLKTYTIPHSATLLKAMVKPAYDILKSSTGPSIIFVPSKAACRSVVSDLVTQSGTEMDMNGFLTASREEVEPLLQRLRDVELFEPILHGIGYILPGTPPSDLSLVLELFASGVLKALIVPREACWTLPLRAENVIIMSAQYTHTTPPPSSERIVLNYSRTELVRMQGFAVGSAHQSAGGRMFVMCQAEQGVGISRILNDGLPLESTLPKLLRREADTKTEEALGRMLKVRAPPPRPQRDRPRRVDLRKRDMVDLLGWTYYAKRAVTNPSYYDLYEGMQAEAVSRLVDEWFRKGGEEFGEDQSSLGGSSLGRSLARSRTASMSTCVMESNGRGMNGSAPAKEVEGVQQDGMEVNQEVKGDAAVGDADGEALTGQPGVPVE